MTLATAILRAPHIGVRDLKAHLSQKLKSHRPLIVTEHGEPKQVIVPYLAMVELADRLEESYEPAPVTITKLSRKALKKTKMEMSLLSESALKRDWLKSQEDRAWKNL